MTFQIMQCHNYAIEVLKIYTGKHENVSQIITIIIMLKISGDNENRV